MHYRRRQLCKLAAMTEGNFKNLQGRGHLPFAASYEEETTGRGGYTFPEAVLLDARNKLVEHGGIPSERAARILGNLGTASFDAFGDHEAWVPRCAAGALYLVERTEHFGENEGLWDTGRCLGALPDVAAWLGASEYPVAHAVIINLAVSFADVLARASEAGIPTPFDQGA